MLSVGWTLCRAKRPWADKCKGCAIKSVLIVATFSVALTEEKEDVRA